MYLFFYVLFICFILTHSLPYHNFANKKENDIVPPRPQIYYYHQKIDHFNNNIKQDVESVTFLQKYLVYDNYYTPDSHYFFILVMKVIL